MKKVLSSLAALALTASAASAATVTIDFESASTGFATNTFSGLTFNEDIQVLANFGATGPGQTGNVARQATPPFGGFPRGGSVSGSFDGFTVSALSFVVGDSGGDLDIFELIGFDATGAAVASSGSLSSSNAITVGISGTGIASFALNISDNVPSDGGSSVFDNVIFDTELAAVPVPASLPLAMLGLGALGFVARRRKD